MLAKLKAAQLAQAKDDAAGGGDSDKASLIVRSPPGPTVAEKEAQRLRPTTSSSVDASPPPQPAAPPKMKTTLAQRNDDDDEPDDAEADEEGTHCRFGIGLISPGTASIHPGFIHSLLHALLENQRRDDVHGTVPAESGSIIFLQKC